MLMNFICDHNGYELGNARKQQICMKCFLIPRFSSGYTKTVLKMVNCFFHIYSDFIRGSPLLCAPCSARIYPEVFFRIDIEHTPAGRSCTGFPTLTDPFGFSGFFIVFPLHLGADKFHGGKPTTQMRFASFLFHWQGGGLGTAGNAVFVEGAV